MDLELSALLDEDLCLLFEFGFIDRVLLFRALTYLLQIPLGGITYVIWKRNRSWLKAAPPRVSRDT